MDGLGLNTHERNIGGYNMCGVIYAVKGREDPGDFSKAVIATRP